MKNIFSTLGFSLLFLAVACNAPSEKKEAQNANNDSLRYEKETHLKNVKQLTFGGNNAEAYFSFDDKNLSFQSDNEKWGLHCDQIFSMSAETGAKEKPAMISTGKGRTTCSYYLPDGKSILYASTHGAADTCPSTPRMVNDKYVWAIYKEFDIYVADLNGKIIKQLTKEPGYDAEATLSPDGKKIVFTSMRTGDLELYIMNVDGTGLKQITKDLGYDGGAFFSPDGSKLVFRASRPKTPEEVKLYKDLLAKDLVQPTNMEIFVVDTTGANLQQITHLGNANWAPYFHPSGKSIVFASNHHTEYKRVFNLFRIDLDGKNLQQLTYDSVFDAFPMFSRDGKKLVFSSNRFNNGGHDTNVFIADWVE